jgi:hypothetical protein
MSSYNETKAIEAIKELIASGGLSILNDQKKLHWGIKDHMQDKTTERSILLLVVDNGLGTLLRKVGTSPDSTATAMAYKQALKTLTEEKFIQNEAARFALRCFFKALGWSLPAQSSGSVKTAVPPAAKAQKPASVNKAKQQTVSTKVGFAHNPIIGNHRN